MAYGTAKPVPSNGGVEGATGRPMPMYLSDLWGPFTVIIPVTFISGCLAFAFLGAHSDGGLIVFALLYGFFSGGLVSLSAPASALFSRNVGEIGYVYQSFHMLMV
ncbi:hypothetical protein B0H13DRAFT_2361891 [Mycena leptocephala]|nr:hypothetical protein B0H13DRAFT_2361891 [Mycena leptocephala]